MRALSLPSERIPSHRPRASSWIRLPAGRLLTRIAALLFLWVAAWGLADRCPPVDLEPVAAAKAAGGPVDSDGDGLSDAFESYLNTASTAARFAADPLDPDSDHDGQIDGFEYCLSGGHEVVSPGVVHPVEPKVTFGSHQVGNVLELAFYVVPADLSVVDQFHFLVAVPGPSGLPVVFELTDLLAQIGIQSVDVVDEPPYSMAVFRTLIPVSLISSFSSFSVAGVGKIAGVPVGDSATYTTVFDKLFRWVYTPLDPAGTSSLVQGEAQPQDAQLAAGAATQEVCRTVDISDPTGTPGVLQRVTVSAGCGGGDWTCVAGICTATGPLAGPKVVLDHLELLE